MVGPELVQQDGDDDVAAAARDEGVVLQAVVVGRVVEDINEGQALHCSLVMGWQGPPLLCGRVQHTSSTSIYIYTERQIWREGDD